MQIRSISTYSERRETKNKIKIHYEKSIVGDGPVTRSRMHAFDLFKGYKTILKEKIKPRCIKIKGLYHYFYPDKEAQVIFHFCVNQMLEEQIALAAYGSIRAFLKGKSNAGITEMVNSLEELLSFNESYHPPKKTPVLVKDDVTLTDFTKEQNDLWNMIEEKIKNKEDIEELVDRNIALTVKIEKEQFNIEKRKLDREVNKYGDIKDLVKQTEQLRVSNLFRSPIVLKPRKSFWEKFWGKFKEFFISLFSCFSGRRYANDDHQQDDNVARPLR